MWMIFDLSPLSALWNETRGKGGRLADQQDRCTGPAGGVRGWGRSNPTKSGGPPWNWNLTDSPGRQPVTLS